MKYKTLFRVLLKLVGVFFIVDGVAWALGVSEFLYRWLVQSPGGGITTTYFGGIGQALAALWRMAIGLYLFFGGRWIVDRAVPGNRPYCHECGYDLSGAPSGRCPECGIALPPSSPS